MATGAALAPSMNRVFAALRQRVPGAQALILVRADGTVVDQCVIDRPSFQTEGLAQEYLPLLHIARRASEDMGAGDVAEHIVVTDSLILAACRVGLKHFSIIVASSGEHLGRLRFELKRIGGDLRDVLRRER
ncbi:MAG TPA: hypothetical protein VFY29_18695 [Terriglobia bacterium]|nr:hypothetical protein [Terriglobia bacterium]